MILKKDKIERRKFINQTSRIATCGLLLSSVSGCGTEDEEIDRIHISQTVPIVSDQVESSKNVEPKTPPKLSVKISADLGRVGGSQEVKNRDILNKLKIKEPKDTILLVRKDPDTITATNTLCSHNGCTIAYNKKQKSLDCPCHGGRFNLDGSVKIGPPNVPLRTVSTGIEGDRVIFLGEAKR